MSAFVGMRLCAGLAHTRVRLRMSVVVMSDFFDFTLYLSF